MNRVSLAAFAACALVSSAALAQPVVPKPIPKGYGFPTDKAIIEGWVAKSNTKAIRTHAWDLWAGMGADSGEKYSGQELPIWETWEGSADVFPPPGAAAAVEPTAPKRAFVRPHQFIHDRRLKKVKIDADEPSDLVAFNKFDPTAAGFIKKPHPGPGGASFQYNSGASLTALNGAFPPGTSSTDRAIADFPSAAIETKPVMSLVKATGLTPLPLWQGKAGTTNPTNPTPNTWTSCVLVDPKGTGKVRKATAAEEKAAAPAPSLACKSYLYAPLSDLYSFTLSAAEAAAFNQAQGGGAAAGDFAVLVAMHVNSKEIPNWTWQTFWWQPGQDTPGGYPGSKAGMTKAVKAPWSNYAMCTNYDQTTTPGGSTMDVCFNPYLETSPGIPDGIHSNCMSCHGTATAGTSAGYPSSYTAPITFFTDATYFNGTTTHTDFSWAVADAP